MPNPMNSSNFPLDRENVTRCKSLESDALGKIPWNNCAYYYSLNNYLKAIFVRITGQPVWLLNT